MIIRSGLLKSFDSLSKKIPGDTKMVEKSSVLCLQEALFIGTIFMQIRFDETAPLRKGYFDEFYDAPIPKVSAVVLSNYG
jgi:hypothetical protein